MAASHFSRQLPRLASGPQKSQLEKLTLARAVREEVGRVVQLSNLALKTVRIVLHAKAFTTMVQM